MLFANVLRHLLNSFLVAGAKLQIFSLFATPSSKNFSNSFFKSLPQIRLENSLVKAGAKLQIFSLFATLFSKNF